MDYQNTYIFYRVLLAITEVTSFLKKFSNELLNCLRIPEVSNYIVLHLNSTNMKT